MASNPTLRDALRYLSEQGASITVRAGANSPFGEEGRRISPRALLGALLPEESERPVILTWDTPPPGYQLSPGHTIGWLYLFAAPGKVQEAPALLVYDARADRGDTSPDRRERIEEHQEEGE
jgi:hypothetical protein